MFGQQWLTYIARVNIFHKFERNQFQVVFINVFFNSKKYLQKVLNAKSKLTIAIRMAICDKKTLVKVFFFLLKLCLLRKKKFYKIKKNIEVGVEAMGKSADFVSYLIFSTLLQDRMFCNTFTNRLLR